MAFPSLLRRFALASVVAVAALAGSLAIPHDPYIRWQDMRSEAWARLGWIYERIHFDETPVDIAFIGTSHTMNGVDGAAVRAALAAAGGTCRHVVNLAFPSYGRNMHWLIARELLEHRKVGTLVLEVFENESRKAHPFFNAVADVSDVLQAPLLINLNYLSDLAQLPARQALGVGSMAHAWGYGLTRLGVVEVESVFARRWLDDLSELPSTPPPVAEPTAADVELIAEQPRHLPHLEASGRSCEREASGQRGRPAVAG